MMRKRINKMLKIKKTTTNKILIDFISKKSYNEIKENNRRLICNPSLRFCATIVCLVLMQSQIKGNP